MAQIMECDVCGKTCKCYDGHIVDIMQMTSIYSRGKREQSIDICPECFKKLKEVLNIVK